MTTTFKEEKYKGLDIITEERNGIRYVNGTKIITRYNDLNGTNKEIASWSSRNITVKFKLDNKPKDLKED